MDRDRLNSLIEEVKTICQRNRSTPGDRDTENRLAEIAAELEEIIDFREGKRDDIREGVGWLWTMIRLFQLDDFLD